MKVLFGTRLAAALLALLAQQATADEGSWNFAAETYLWGAGVNGKTPAGNPVDLPFDDIVDNLDMGFMGAFAASKGRWTLFVDDIYLDLQDKGGFSLSTPPVSGKAEAELKGSILTLGAGYQLLGDEQYTVSAVLGARYLDLDAELSVSPVGLPTAVVKERLEDWNGIVGARAKWHFDKHWYVSGYADVGTGDSHITWQAIANAGYSFGCWDLTAGYRYLKWEFEKGDNALFEEADISGPFAGAVFHF